MKPLFPQFDVEYISGVMSLRKPQKTSLRRLADIVEEVPPCKNPDLVKNKETIHSTRIDSGDLQGRTRLCLQQRQNLLEYFRWQPLRRLLHLRPAEMDGCRRGRRHQRQPLRRLVAHGL